MSVTNPLKNSSYYDENGWGKKELTDDFVQEVIDNAKKSYSTLFFYAVGVYVTSYARRNVYMTLLKLDKDEIYCDTDSIKYRKDHTDIFEEYNKNIYKKYEKVCKELSQLNIDDFMPKDPQGNKHPIGFFSYEGKVDFFKTLGAKKYCYVKDGKISITVSGVSKKGASALKSIDDFKKGFTWGYKESGKLAHFYNEEQPHVDITDYEGNVYHNTYDYGVILQPTTYTLGLTDEFIALMEIIQDWSDRR